MKKLKAFTLVETVVALIITVVVVVLCMRLFLNLGSLYERTLKNEDRALHFLLFYTSLKHDFLQADSLTAEKNVITAHIQQRQMVYQFSKSGVVYGNVANAVYDSVVVDIDRFSIYYKERSIVSRIAFSIKMNGLPTQNVFLSKNYSGKGLYLTSRKNYEY